jgi:hypothetical protein
MGLDIRMPIGTLFITFGVLLTLFGLKSDPSLYVKSLGVNVNLDWSFVLLVIGALFIWLAIRKRRILCTGGTRSSTTRPSPPRTL